jgi:hypothetical protein
MIKENSFGSKYLNVPANKISSRGKIIAWGADTEQSKASDVQSRNWKTSNFQNRGAEFGTKINLKKEQRPEVIAALLSGVKY